MAVTITTNNRRREILDGYQLTAKEREEFDYVDWAAIEEGSDSRSFVRYRGDVLDLNDMDGITPEGSLREAGWDTYTSDSFSSGLVFRYVKADYGSYDVVVGSYYFHD
jgi:hypothetical protein